jgi:hypothetical protein
MLNTMATDKPQPIYDESGRPIGESAPPPKPKPAK